MPQGRIQVPYNLAHRPRALGKPRRALEAMLGYDFALCLA